MNWVAFRRNARLLLAFTKRELKMSYHGSILGAFWYLLNPVFMFVVLYVIFSKRFGADIDNYAVYLLIGIIQWNFFQTAVSASMRTVFQNSALIRSFNFRRELIVIAPVLAALVGHFIELLVFAVVLIYYKVNLLYLVFLVPIIILQFLFALGFSFAFASILVYVMDLQTVWGYVSRVWWVATPIFYATAKKSKLFLANLWFNPQFQFIHTSRNILISHKFPAVAFLLYMTAVSVGTFIIGYLIFRRLKRRFPELV